MCQRLVVALGPTVVNSSEILVSTLGDGQSFTSAGTLDSIKQYNDSSVHLNEFLIGHYIKSTYLINASKVWLLWIVDISLSKNGKKNNNIVMYKTVHAER